MPNCGPRLGPRFGFLRRLRHRSDPSGRPRPAPHAVEKRALDGAALLRPGLVPAALVGLVQDLLVEAAEAEELVALVGEEEIKKPLASSG